jgi:hypothetical protein
VAGKALRLRFELPATADVDEEEAAGGIHGDPPKAA